MRLLFTAFLFCRALSACSGTYIAWEGDSITVGTNTTGTHAYSLALPSVFVPNIVNTMFAVSGSQLNHGGSPSLQMTMRASTVDASFDATKCLNILSILIGANDLASNPPVISAASFFSDLKAYCQARKMAHAWTIAIVAILPRDETFTNGQAFNSKRDAANTSILGDSSFYDVFVRLDLDPTIGCDSCAVSGENTYFDNDGIHPSNTGHAIITTIYRAALIALGVPQQTPAFGLGAMR